MKLTDRWNWAKLPLLFLILSAMSACATVSTAPVNSYCGIAVPIAYDGAVDTPATVFEIEQHNSKWVCICENDCPKQAE